MLLHELRPGRRTRRTHVSYADRVAMAYFWWARAAIRKGWLAMEHA